MKPYVVVFGLDGPGLHTVALLLAKAGYSVDEVPADPHARADVLGGCTVRHLQGEKTAEDHSELGEQECTRPLIVRVVPGPPPVDHEQDREFVAIETGTRPNGLPASAIDGEHGDVALAERYATLTRREREVAALVSRGLLNKQIAAALEISERTVKLHRARAMHKLQAHSLADLVRYVDRIELRDRLTKACHSIARETPAVDVEMPA